MMELEIHGIGFSDWAEGTEKKGKKNFEESRRINGISEF